MNRVTSGLRQLWRVTLDPAFAAMLREDLHLYYDPAPLAKIEAGVAQAIALPPRPTVCRQLDAKFSVSELTNPWSTSRPSATLSMQEARTVRLSSRPALLPTPVGLVPAGAEHEKRERAVPALPGREMARTGSGDIGSRNQIQSHPVGRATVCVR